MRITLAVRRWFGIKKINCAEKMPPLSDWIKLGLGIAIIAILFYAVINIGGSIN